MCVCARVCLCARATHARARANTHTHTHTRTSTHTHTHTLSRVHCHPQITAQEWISLPWVYFPLQAFQNKGYQRSSVGLLKLHYIDGSSICLSRNCQIPNCKRSRDAYSDSDDVDGRRGGAVRASANEDPRPGDKRAAAEIDMSSRIGKRSAVPSRSSYEDDDSDEEEVVNASEYEASEDEDARGRGRTRTRTREDEDEEDEDEDEDEETRSAEKGGRGRSDAKRQDISLGGGEGIEYEPTARDAGGGDDHIEEGDIGGGEEGSEGQSEGGGSMVWTSTDTACSEQRADKQRGGRTARTRRKTSRQLVYDDAGAPTELHGLAYHSAGEGAGGASEDQGTLLDRMGELNARVLLDANRLQHMLCSVRAMREEQTARLAEMTEKYRQETHAADESLLREQARTLELTAQLSHLRTSNRPALAFMRDQLAVMHAFQTEIARGDDDVGGRDDEQHRERDD